MPGFLSRYSGTEKIDLGDGYWVEVKENLTTAEWQRVQTLLGAGKQSVDMRGRQFAQVDFGASQRELVVLSITDWNLDDDDENTLPLKPEKVLRSVVDQLPAEVFMKIYEVCDRTNKDRQGREAATFPDQAGAGGEERDGGAGGAGELPDEGGVLGAAGGDQGEPGETPAP
jgi:hypothetical protein